MYDDIKKEIAVDMNGFEIRKGQTVLIHQDDGIREATVVEVLMDSPTMKEKGFWIDVYTPEGVGGIMSYIIEVKRKEIVILWD